MELDGKIALVTGAGRGIGKAASLKYAENGADLIIADINEDLIEQTALEVRNIGRNCITVKVDVGDLESIDNMISTAKDEIDSLRDQIIAKQNKFSSNTNKSLFVKSSGVSCTVSVNKLCPTSTPPAALVLSNKILFIELPLMT